ncbi:hypothetical protein J1614_004870 [Plenodomus biglobosus]|nr:hypothetical protein J1614_004870 [Plenodomus biglobosus]
MKTFRLEKFAFLAAWLQSRSLASATSRATTSGFLHCEDSLSNKRYTSVLVSRRRGRAVDLRKEPPPQLGPGISNSISPNRNSGSLPHHRAKNISANPLLYIITPTSLTSSSIISATALQASRKHLPSLDCRS